MSAPYPCMNESYASGYLLLSGAKMESWGRSDIRLRRTKADTKRLDTRVNAAAPDDSEGNSLEDLSPCKTALRLIPRIGVRDMLVVHAKLSL